MNRYLIHFIISRWALESERSRISSGILNKAIITRVHSILAPTMALLTVSGKQTAILWNPFPVGFSCQCIWSATSLHSARHNWTPTLLFAAEVPQKLLGSIHHQGPLTSLQLQYIAAGNLHVIWETLNEWIQFYLHEATQNDKNEA